MKVELYENNAGGLYLRRDDRDYALGSYELGSQLYMGKFEEHARALATDDALEGTERVPMVELDHPEVRLVASWENGRVSTDYDALGNASARYLAKEG